MIASYKYASIIFYKIFFLDKQMSESQVDSPTFANQLASVTGTIVKSKSSDALNKIENIDDESVEPTSRKPRGRRCKYANDDERRAARRQQQREYRLRKKYEMEILRRYVEEHLDELEEEEEDTPDGDNIDCSINETINETPDDEPLVDDCDN